MDLSVKTEPQKPDRLEIFNFKKEESKIKFRELTSQTNQFTECFEDDTPLLNQIEQWQQVLKTFCMKSFDKIRIGKKNSKPLRQPMGKLIDERNALVNLVDEESKLKLEEITKKISQLEAEENRNKLVQNFKELGENPESVNMQQVWKTLKRLWPKAGSSLPVAKKNHKGKIVSAPKDIKSLLAREYKDCLVNGLCGLIFYL